MRQYLVHIDTGKGAFKLVITAFWVEAVKSDTLEVDHRLITVDGTITRVEYPK